MAKRKRNLTIDKINKRFKEGRGKGVGEKYKPFIETLDVASIGRSTKIRGWKTNRVHHFLSDLERNYFLYLEWDENVIDIKEQFPNTSLANTLKIANDLGIRHPCDPKTKTPIIITTDFLLTVKRGDRVLNVARTCKYKKDLSKKRVIEKFQIEKKYWEDKGVDWGIITELNINKNFVENLRNIHQIYWDTEIVEPSNNAVHYLIDAICNYENNDKNLAAIANDSDYINNLEIGTSIRILKYLIAHKAIKLDMNKKLNFRSLTPGDLF